MSKREPPKYLLYEDVIHIQCPENESTVRLLHYGPDAFYHVMTLEEKTTWTDLEAEAETAEEPYIVAMPRNKSNTDYEAIAYLMRERDSWQRRAEQAEASLSRVRTASWKLLKDHYTQVELDAMAEIWSKDYIFVDPEEEVVFCAPPSGGCVRPPVRSVLSSWSG